MLGLVASGVVPSGWSRGLPGGTVLAARSPGVAAAGEVVVRVKIKKVEILFKLLTILVSLVYLGPVFKR
jgi:hypothetical protein